MQHLVFGAFVFLSSILFALAEIQIEGPDGWAAKLPTWRADNPWVRCALGGRPLTGYHAYVHSFFLAVVHLPYALGLSRFSVGYEARILAFVVLFWTLEDFLWFVLNPAYGISGFTREHIWWHRSAWWWIAPREYWLAMPAGICLYVFSYL